jgi:hypothetical protein
MITCSISNRCIAGPIDDLGVKLEGETEESGTSVISGYICICVSIIIYMYIYMNICMYLYICICTYIYVYI